MKYSTSFVLFSLILALTNCSKDGFSDLSKEKLKDFDSSLSSKHVTLNDVFSFVSHNYRKDQTRSNNDLSIVPIVSTNNDTLLYVVNYSQGWDILSSDKRVPAIVAHSDSGRFILDYDNESLTSWLSMVAEDLSYIIHSPDSCLSFSAEEIRSNMSRWGGGGLFPPSDTIADEPTGHYEAYDYQMIQEMYDHIDHLTQTRWSQGTPFNYYCPLNSLGDHKKVGCVAVAGAQMLYYLHYEIGFPDTLLRDSTYVSGRNIFDSSLPNASSDVWDDVSRSYNEDYYHLVATIMAHVGNLIGMHYENGYSWAWPSNLKDDLFDVLGINCYYEDYDYVKVRQSLLNNMPVIVAASSNLVLGIPQPIDWHCFIIDGYSRVIYGTRTYYRWIDEFGHYDPSSHPDYYVDTFEQSPSVNMIKMNWGWKSQWYSPPVNDGWYSLTGSWIVENDGDINYNTYRKMIYGFSVNNN